jgi:hypothetical protein
VFFTTLPLTLPIAARKDEVGHSANSMGRGGAGEPPQVASPQVSEGENMMLIDGESGDELEDLTDNVGRSEGQSHN